MIFPLVSVVITTKNEEKNIGNCLKSIMSQTYPNDKIEIIVVDNNSEDKTKKIAGKYTKKLYNYPPANSRLNITNFRGAQLNYGVSKASGEIIFFPDADMTFDKALIDEAVNFFNGTKIDALYIPEIICGKGFFGKVRNFERNFYNETCIDAVRIVKKSVFEKVGGFDEKNIPFGPDDWDFTKTLKKNRYKLMIVDKCLFHHEENLTLEKYLEKKSGYSNTFDGYIKKWTSDPDVGKQLGAKYRLFKVFIENGKWKRILRHPLLTLGLYYIKVRQGFNYIRQKYN